MNDQTVFTYVFKMGNLWECVEKNMLTEDFLCISEEKDLFELVRLENIDELNAAFADELERVKIVATDGATTYMRETIDAMDEETFAMWLKYHFTVCERMDLIGATAHSLDILRKR